MKTVKSLIQFFEDKKIRTLFDEENQAWYFSIVDVCAVLSQTKNAAPRNYWNDLKRKLKSEKNELHEKIVQLKMPAEDGKMRETDVLCTKDIVRLVQEIPSKKAKQFRIWIAKVAVEKIAEKRQAKLAAVENAQITPTTKKPTKNKQRKIWLFIGLLAFLLAAAAVLAAVL